MDFSAMNHLPLQFALLVLLLNNYETVASNDINNVAKRLNVDVCSERFDIHSSTIIRTEESKLMGAKFLQDDDIGSAEACLKLCCETNDCDVFIYEEKSLGSCFLFHCGVPDDFRCKFTSHSNYTSGVLTVPRRELEPQATTSSLVAIKSKLSQNELELVNLKRPSNAYHSSLETASTTSTSSTVPPLAVRIAEITPSTQSAIKSSCGRFQFQCQTSKECIAIYNVCDQIAQCEDGSDEGPECPASNSAMSKTVLSGPENQNGQQNRNRGTSNINDNFQMPRQPVIHNREDPLSAPRYPQSHVTQYTDTDTESKIFNHKGGLLNGDNFPASQYPSKFQRDPYVLPQSGSQSMDDSLYREQSQIMRNDWAQMLQQQQAPQSTPNRPINPVWPDKLTKQVQGNDKISSKKGQNKNSEYSEEYSDGEEAQSEDATTTEAPKKKLRKHKKVKLQKEKQQKSHEKTLHEQLKQLKSSNDIEAKFISEHSGHVEKPTGAVLSLTLGCLVLAALSVLIGCRLRRVNVRRRRGKSVEADYLVNGLYL